MKDKHLKQDAEELLKDLEDLYVDFVHNDFGNWEDTMEVVDNARGIIERLMEKANLR
jgi:hypothetical protein